MSHRRERTGSVEKVEDSKRYPDIALRDCMGNTRCGHLLETVNKVNEKYINPGIIRRGLCFNHCGVSPSEYLVFGLQKRAIHSLPDPNDDGSLSRLSFSRPFSYMSTLHDPIRSRLSAEMIVESTWQNRRTMVPGSVLADCPLNCIRTSMRAMSRISYHAASCEPRNVHVRDGPAVPPEYLWN